MEEEHDRLRTFLIVFQAVCLGLVLVWLVVGWFFPNERSYYAPPGTVVVLRACGDDHLVKLCATVDDHTFVAASQAVRLFRVGPNKPEYIEVHYGFFGNSYSAYDVYVHEQ